MGGMSLGLAQLLNGKLVLASPSVVRPHSAPLCHWQKGALQSSEAGAAGVVCIGHRSHFLQGFEYLLTNELLVQCPYSTLLPAEQALCTP